MTSIDELFKKPNLPGTGSKRKLSPTRNPTELYKSAKLSANGDAKGKGHDQNGGIHARVEEEDEDIEAGPELPPDDDDTEEPQDDDEGRFFGGGVSRDTADVLDFIEGREGDEGEAVTEKFDAAWVKRLALNFERRISKNAQLRAKFETDPPKFMGSEADLDADIKALSILTEHAELYKDFAKLGCIASLVSLLTHDNTDIAIDAIEILSELTDEDVQAEQEQWDAVVEASIEADLPSLLIDNLKRLDESSEADRNGVYHSLSLLENLSSQSAIAEKLIESSALLKWLLSRIQKKETPLGQNTQYSAEVLSILLQSTPKTRSEVVRFDGVDVILQLLAFYRKRDPPKDTDEEEYAENLFDALVCLVDDPVDISLEENNNNTGKHKFIEAEGIELMLLMLGESKSKFSRPRALRVLDHALSGRVASGAAEMGEKLVEAAGLKTVFSTFMKLKDHASLEHFLGIFSNLMRCLPGDSSARIRLLAKFVEKDYEKTVKIVELRRDFTDRLAPVDRKIKAEQDGMTEQESEDAADEFLSRRLDAGLFCLQTIDVLLAWLVAEDRGAKKKISDLLADQGKSFQDIKLNLQEQTKDLARGDAGKTGPEETERQDSVEMLKTLIEFLE